MWVNVQEWRKPLHGESYTLRHSEESKPFQAVCQISTCGAELWFIHQYCGVEVEMNEGLQVSVVNADSFKSLSDILKTKG